MWLQVYMGLAWTLGCATVGLLIVREPTDCRIARQYLCQVLLDSINITRKNDTSWWKETILLLSIRFGSLHHMCLYIASVLNCFFSRDYRKF